MDDIKILIVEANEELRWLMTEFLELQEGITVVDEVSDGIEALQILSEEKVDIIMMEIVMPNMNGFALLEEIRKIDMNPVPKVMVVSSLAQKDFIKRAYALGADCYITKPFSTDTLLFQIWDIVNRLAANL